MHKYCIIIITYYYHYYKIAIFFLPRLQTPFPTGRIPTPTVTIPAHVPGPFTTCPSPPLGLLMKHIQATKATKSYRTFFVHQFTDLYPPPDQANTATVKPHSVAASTCSPVYRCFSHSFLARLPAYLHLDRNPPAQPTEQPDLHTTAFQRKSSGSLILPNQLCPHDRCKKDIDVLGDHLFSVTSPKFFHNAIRDTTYHII
jgi:hypothetical protein